MLFLKKKELKRYCECCGDVIPYSRGRINYPYHLVRFCSNRCIGRNSDRKRRLQPKKRYFISK